MFYISDIATTAPAEFKTPLQQDTYKALKNLNIPFERVDTDCIFRNNCASVPEERSAIPLETEQSSAS